MNFEDLVQETRQQAMDAHRATATAGAEAHREKTQLQKDYEAIRQETIGLVQRVKTKLIDGKVPPDAKILKQEVMARHEQERARLHPERRFPERSPSMFHTLTLGMIAAGRRANRDNSVHANSVGAWKMTSTMYLGEDDHIYGIGGMTNEEQKRGVLIPNHAFRIDQEASAEPTQKEIDGFGNIQQGLAEVIVHHHLPWP